MFNISTTCVNKRLICEEYINTHIKHKNTHMYTPTTPADPRTLVQKSYIFTYYHIYSKIKKLNIRKLKERKLKTKNDYFS